METPELQAVLVPLSKLKAAAYNPRRLSDVQLDSLVGSIKAFGFVEPVVANSRTRNIVGGHARVMAARKLGYKSVPVVWVNLDDEHERSLNVALNKIGGEFDNDMLAELLLDLPDDLIELTGFDVDFMDELQPAPLDVADDTEAPTPDKPKVPKYTTDDLRVLSKTYFPADRQNIDSFLLWLDDRA